MKFIQMFATILVAMLWTAFPVQADFIIPNVTIDVFASSAPNAYGSPSFSGWMANTQCFLQGTCSEGDRSINPTGFETLTTFDPGDAMVTSFNSWRGQADPGMMFGPAFGSELGNRMHFPMHIASDIRFTLSDIRFNISSPDSGSSGYGGSGYLGYSGTLAGTVFNGTSRVGLSWGTDGIAGTADDITYNSGEIDGTMVNELFYVGVGNALWPQVSTGESYQKTLDNAARFFPTAGIWSIAGTYTLFGDYEGGASVRLVKVPEPGTVLLFGTGFIGLIGFRMRGKSPDIIPTQSA